MIRKIPWIVLLNDLCTFGLLLLEKHSAVGEKTLAKYTFINHDCLHIVRALFISYSPLLYPASVEKLLQEVLFWNLCVL